MATGATGMGQITEGAFVISNLASNEAGAGCNTEMRQTTLTATNHDRLVLDATGISCTTSKTAVTAVDAYQVVGGTGRYSGARGFGTDTASVIIGKTAAFTLTGILSTSGSLM